MTYKNYLIYEENGEIKITDHIGTIVINEDLIKLLEKIYEKQDK